MSKQEWTDTSTSMKTPHAHCRLLLWAVVCCQLLPLPVLDRLASQASEERQHFATCLQKILSSDQLVYSAYPGPANLPRVESAFEDLLLTTNLNTVRDLVQEEMAASSAAAPQPLAAPAVGTVWRGGEEPPACFAVDSERYRVVQSEAWWQPNRSGIAWIGPNSLRTSGRGKSAELPLASPETSTALPSPYQKVDRCVGLSEGVRVCLYRDTMDYVDPRPQWWPSSDDPVPATPDVDWFSAILAGAWNFHPVTHAAKQQALAPAGATISGSLMLGHRTAGQEQYLATHSTNGPPRQEKNASCSLRFFARHLSKPFPSSACPAVFRLRIHNYSCHFSSEVTS